MYAYCVPLRYTHFYVLVYKGDHMLYMMSQFLFIWVLASPAAALIMGGYLGVSLGLFNLHWVRMQMCKQ